MIVDPEIGRATLAFHKALTDKDCDKATQIAKTVDDPELVVLAAACKARAPTPVARVGGSTGGTAGTGGVGLAPPDPTTFKDLAPGALLGKARGAADASDWRASLAFAERFLAKKPNGQIGLQLAAIASCKLRNKQKATQYIALLRPAAQAMVRQLCAREGVVIPEAAPQSD